MSKDRIALIGLDVQIDLIC